MSNTPSKRGRVAVISAGPAGMATAPLDTSPVPDQRTT
jgi:NADPH-dependent glutamate synthase beta subunit-like oxidoreductase